MHQTDSRATGKLAADHSATCPDPTANYLSVAGEHDDIKGRRILVVEDEYMLADVICQELKRVGAEVVGPVPNAREAVVQAFSADFDAAILDINLQGIPTYAPAEAVMQRAIPFVFVSGYDCTDMPTKFWTYPCVEKPANLLDIIHALASALRQQR